MGCGKSTAGKLAAQALGLDYFDTDRLVAEKENMDIPHIFSEKGEPYFRRAEAETVRGLAGRDAVVACGGGAMLNRETAEFAGKNGLVIFLDVPFDVCYGRIRGDERRPLAASSTEDELRSLFEARRSVYRENSGLCLECTDSSAHTADMIVDAVKSRYRE